MVEMTEKRNPRDIRIDMLKHCMGVLRNKTSIVYQCNLNFHIVNKHLTWCFIHGWMEKIGTEYLTTELGKAYINLMTPVLAMEEQVILEQ